MLGNYKALSENIQNRLDPEALQSFQKSFSEELRSLSYSNVLQFIKSAMQGVPNEYTLRIKEAGENVKDHLRTSLTDVSYRFQGSVMTNTHIMGYSDIDLLVLNEKSYTYDMYNMKKYINEESFRSKLYSSQVKKLEQEVNDFSQYKGDPLLDLRENRLASENTLKNIYIECNISKPKSIKIRNRSLKKDVDIVIAGWYEDVRSIIFDKGNNRGIQVYNKDEHTKGNPDFPFISIERINERGSLTNGRLKKMIRFLKNVKGASNLDIDLSSFDINAICYDIPIREYESLSFYELVTVIYNQLFKICDSIEYANKISSVDDREYIFISNPNKLANVKKILQEVTQVYLDLSKTKILI